MSSQLQVTWADGDRVFDQTVRVHIGGGPQCQVRLNSVAVTEALVAECHGGTWSVRIRPGADVAGTSGPVAAGSTVAIDNATNLWIEAVKVSLIPSTATDQGQASSAPETDVAAPQTNSIEVVTPDGARVLPPGSYSIGRASGADVRVQASDVGRSHATLRFHQGTWRFTDHSQNGSYLNGTRVSDELSITVATTVVLGSAHGSAVALTPANDSPPPPTTSRPADPVHTASVVQHQRLELTLDQVEVQVVPGQPQPASFVLRTKNLHPTEVLTITLTASCSEGDPTWLSFAAVGGLPSGRIHLQADGGSADILCHVNVPRQPDSHPGLYSFTVNGNDGNRLAHAVSIGVRVLPFIDFAISPPARRTTTARGNRVASRKLTAHNRSNIRLALHAPQLDDAERLNVAAEQQVMNLAPGQTKQMSFDLSLVEKPSVFERKEYGYTLSGTAVGQTSGGAMVTNSTERWEFNGNYVRRPILPLWLLVALPVLAGLYLGAATGLGIWPFTQGATASMPPVVGLDVQAAHSAIASAVPCKLESQDVRVIPTGTSPLTCQVSSVSEPSDQPPGTVLRSSPRGGDPFPDINNIVIELAVAEARPGPGDVDGDGVVDPSDNCVEVVNPAQENLDNDQFGDACDPDIDDDGAGGPFGNGADCNDEDPLIGPNAREIPGNGIDEDCDGADGELEISVVCRVSDRGPLDIGQATTISAEVRSGSSLEFRYDLDDGRVVPGGASLTVEFDQPGDKTVRIEWSSRTQNGTETCLPIEVLPPRIVPSTLSGSGLLAQLADLSIEANVSFRPNNTLPQNTVVSVDPAAGTVVPRDGVVDVVVSTGPASSAYQSVLASGTFDIGAGGGFVNQNGQLDAPQIEHLEALLQKTFDRPIEITFQTLAASDRFTALQVGAVEISLVSSRSGAGDTELLLWPVGGETLFIAVQSELARELRPNHERLLIEAEE